MGRRSSMPEGTERRMLEMVLCGATNQAIARNLGRSLSTVVYWRRQLNITKTLSEDFIQYRLKTLDK